jgi:hypothetical protein
MKASLRISTALVLLFLGLCRPAKADDAPTILIMHSGSNWLKEDVKLIFSLTSPAEQKQWSVIEDHLDEIFLLGIDGARPLRVDMVSEKNQVHTRISYPVSDFKEFLRNVELFGIDLKRKTNSYYELSKTYEGHLRLIDGYAVIAPLRELVPATKFKPLNDDLVKKYFLGDNGEMHTPGLGFALVNESAKPADRRKNFENVKKELLAAVSQAEDETKEDFELRKAMTELQIDELARYYADPKEVLITGAIDHQAKVGRLALDLLPDQKTDLAAAVATVGTKPSYFASQQIPENQILSFTINLSLDPAQQVNTSKVIKLQADRGNSKVDAEGEFTDEQKASVKKAISLASEAVESTLKEHGLDFFVHCTPHESGKHTILGGMYLNKSENLTELFKLMPSFPEPRQVTLDVDRQGEVTIHQFEFGAEIKAAMDDFFGVDAMYVGVGPQVAWFAFGENALATLKTAIETTDSADPQEPSNEFFAFSIKAAPWIGWQDRHAKQPPADRKTEIKQVAGTQADGNPDTRQQLTNLPIRELALEAFAPGDDVLTMSLRRDKDRIKGDLKADTGLLRFVGKVLARFSKENLEE